MLEVCKTMKMKNFFKQVLAVALFLMLLLGCIAAWAENQDGAPAEIDMPEIGDLEIVMPSMDLEPIVPSVPAEEPVAADPVVAADPEPSVDEPAAAPVVEPVAPPVAEPVEQPVAEPVVQPVAEPAANDPAPVIDPVPETPQTVSYTVNYYMLERAYDPTLDVQPPRYNVQIAAPQTFEAMPGTVITAAQIGLPQQVFAQYSGLPFALAERQDDGAMTVSAGASITVYYTLPLKLSVQDSMVTANGLVQYGNAEIKAEGNLPDVDHGARYTPAQGTEAGAYIGSFDLTDVPVYYASVSVQPGTLTILEAPAVSQEPAEEEPAADEPEDEVTDTVSIPEVPAVEVPGEPAEEVPAAPANYQVNVTLSWDNDQPGLGSTAHFKAEVSGCEGVQYTLKWQRSSDNVNWYDVNGATGAQYDVVITEQNCMDYWRVQLVIAD